MSQFIDSATRPAIRPRPRRRKWYWTFGTVPALAAGMSWYLTEPLVVTPTATADRVAARQTVATPAPALASSEAGLPLGWGQGRLEGDPAKQELLDAMLAVRDRLSAQDGYTAIFRKQERIKGKLTVEQTLLSKVRRDPFAIYLKFLKPSAGKEAVYATGRFDGHMIAHETGLARRLLPRLKVAPDSTLAMAENRHPITDAGLFKLVDKLVSYRELDMDDDLAETILDWHADARGVLRPRSLHLHKAYRPERPFAYVEIFYDAETYLPCEFLGYDWPESPGDSIAPENLELGERYVYEDVNFHVRLTDLDFDPANPDYEFTRF